MSVSRWLWPGLAMAIAVNVAAAQQAQAEPLIPPAPGETEFLEQVRRVFAAGHDPAAVNSDGEILQNGRFACERRDRELVGQGITYVTPAVTQLAFIYLCPK